jgi:hypothetical protein
MAVRNGSSGGFRVKVTNYGDDPVLDIEFKTAEYTDLFAVA